MGIGSCCDLVQWVGNFSSPKRLGENWILCIGYEYGAGLVVAAGGDTYIYSIYMMMMMMMLNLVCKGLGNSLTLGGIPPLRQQPDLHHLHTQHKKPMELKQAKCTHRYILFYCRIIEIRRHHTVPTTARSITITLLLLLMVTNFSIIYMMLMMILVY